jgi:hypothetical protein
MRVEELRTFDHVADQPSEVRRLDAARGLQTQRRGMAVRRRTDAANALRDVVGVPWVPILQDDFEATKQRARRPGILDFPILDFHFDGQVALNTRDRIDDNA